MFRNEPIQKVKNVRFVSIETVDVLLEFTVKVLIEGVSISELCDEGLMF